MSVDPDERPNKSVEYVPPTEVIVNFRTPYQQHTKLCVVYITGGDMDVFSAKRCPHGYILDVNQYLTGNQYWRTLHWHSNPILWWRARRALKTVGE